MAQLTNDTQETTPLAGLGLGAVMGLAVFSPFMYYQPGPEWAWTGCMPPGPGVAGCAMVFPVGILGAVMLAVSVAGVGLRLGAQYHRGNADG